MISLIICLILRYSGLKSCPHCGHKVRIQNGDIVAAEDEVEYDLKSLTKSLTRIERKLENLETTKDIYLTTFTEMNQLPDTFTSPVNVKRLDRKLATLREKLEAYNQHRETVSRLQTHNSTTRNKAKINYGRDLNQRSIKTTH